MKQHTYIFTIIVLSFFILSCHKNIGTTKINPSDSKVKILDSPAFNKELIIDIDGDTIAGYGFIASGDNLKETVLLISGYPGNDTNFDIAQDIRRNGKNVIHFNHRGAWGSQGKYSYSNCLEDVEKLILYLSQEDISKKLKIDITKFSLLGRSYGGGIALIIGSQLPAVKKIIAISSVNYGAIMSRYTSLDELGGFKKYMQKQIMINHDIDDFLQELLDRKKEYEILNYKEKLQGKEVLLIEDSNKNKTWTEQISNAKYIVLESDHNFIDKRKELKNLIIQWLDNH